MADAQEVAELKAFIRGLIGRLRMEYGSAMAVLGLDPEVIISVQQQAAAGMVEWLETV